MRAATQLTERLAMVRRAVLLERSRNSSAEGPNAIVNESQKQMPREVWRQSSRIGIKQEGFQLPILFHLDYLVKARMGSKRAR